MTKDMKFVNESDISSSRMTVTYRAYLNSFLEIERIPAGKDLVIHFKTEIWHEPVEFIGLIQGRLEVPKYKQDKFIHGSMKLENWTVVKDIDCSVSIDRKDYQPQYILGNLVYGPEGEIEETIFGLCYLYREKFENDFGIQFVVPSYGEFTLLNGTVALSREEIQKEFQIDFKVNGICVAAEIDGSVSLLRNIYSNSQMITGWFDYEGINFDNEILFGYFHLDNHRLDCLMQIQFNVKSSDFIYSLFIRFKVVNQYDKDLKIRFSVSNTQIYDIWGFVDLPISRKRLFLLDGTCTLPPYITSEIDGNLVLDRTYTRRDMQIYFYASTPVNAELGINFNVCNIFHRYGRCLQINFWVTKAQVCEYLRLYFRTTEADRIDKDLKIKFRVNNILSPARVVIAVDPLWHYEPFVVKSCLVGFFDRICTKNEVTVVYGGNPRSDYDIEHFAYIFGVRKLIKSPLIYDAKDPGLTKHFVRQFIDAMFMFRRHEPHRVDRAILFMDKPLSFQNNMVLAPIIDICRKAKIPCVCIDSGGNFVEIYDPCHYPPHNPGIHYPNGDTNWGCGHCDCDNHKLVY